MRQYVFLRDNPDLKGPPYVIGPWRTERDAGIWTEFNVPAATGVIVPLVDPDDWEEIE